jgi:release factor glutamine methyltransferase
VCGNGLAFVKQSELFDLIISNPPYICSRDMETLAPEIKNHEPREALDGGEDGLRLYRQWIPQMPALLRREGRAVLEIGSEQALSVSQFFRDAGFSDVTTVKDYAGHNRAVIAQRI